MSAAQKKTAFLAASVAFSILLLFVIVGEIILSGMGVPLPAFQISVVLFIFALSMIFGESKRGRG